METTFLGSVVLKTNISGEKRDIDFLYNYDTYVLSLYTVQVRE